MRIGVDAIPFQAKKAGVARYLGNMLCHMRELAPDVEYVLYALDDVQPPKGIEDLEVRIEHRKGLYRRAQYWLRRTLPRWLAEDGIDAFWGQNITMPLLLRRPCVRVLTVHDLTAFVCPGSMAVKNWLQSRLVFRQAASVSDCVVAVSKATARGIRRFLNVRPADLAVVSEGCGEGIARVPRNDALQRVSSRFGLGGRFLLAVGTVEPRKEYPVLLRALDRVPDPPVLAIVGGEGWKCRAIMEQIRAKEALDRVRYLGKVEDDDLSLLYSAAELMVYPSAYEGFGLPVLEAMTCGCPVLCSWSSSLPEVAGSASRYFRPHDHDDLARQLRLLLCDSDRLAAMSALGLEQASRFSFRSAARDFLSILSRLVVRRSA